MYILPREEGFGEELGRALGTGLGALAYYKLHNKLDDAKRARHAKALKALGYSDAEAEQLSQFDEDILKSVVSERTKLSATSPTALKQFGFSDAEALQLSTMPVKLIEAAIKEKQRMGRLGVSAKGLRSVIPGIGEEEASSIASLPPALQAEFYKQSLGVPSQGNIEEDPDQNLRNLMSNLGGQQAPRFDENQYLQQQARAAQPMEVDPITAIQQQQSPLAQARQPIAQQQQGIESGARQEAAAQPSSNQSEQIPQKVKALKPYFPDMNNKQLVELARRPESEVKEAVIQAVRKNPQLVPKQETGAVSAKQMDKEARIAEYRARKQPTSVAERIAEARRLKLEKQEAKEATKEEKIERHRVNKETQSYYDQVLRDEELADKGIKKAERLRTIIREGKLPGSAARGLTGAVRTFAKFIPFAKGVDEKDVLTAFRNPSSEEFQSIISSFSDEILPKFKGLGQMSDKDVELAFRRLPSLMDTDLGKMRIVDTLMSEYEASKALADGMKRVIKKKGGKRPENIKELARLEAAEDLKRIANKFKYGREWVSLPLPTELKPGFEFTDKATGIKYRNDGERFVPVEKEREKQPQFVT